MAPNGTFVSQMAVGGSHQGSEQDDVLTGGAGSDVLNGGLGQDVLDGGAGNDVIISASDAGRMPSNGSANDVLTGGDGADTFRILLELAASEEVLQTFSNLDGIINWREVAFNWSKAVGEENGDAKGPWLGAIGEDIVTDFDRSEGDKIEIGGFGMTHKLTYVDTDNDGQADHSNIALYYDRYRDAHEAEYIGSLSVFGDIVLESDIAVSDANRSYFGAIDNISQLDELSLMHVATDVGEYWS